MSTAIRAALALMLATDEAMPALAQGFPTTGAQRSGAGVSAAELQPIARPAMRGTKHMQKLTPFDWQRRLYALPTDFGR
ncbi:MAG: hypothetical protein WCH83_06690 [Alphaproteobacteria bacterium]